MPLRIPPQTRTIRTRLRPTVAAEPAPRCFGPGPNGIGEVFDQ